MSEQIKLEATIKATGENLRVGGNPDPSNTLILTIENMGDDKIISETRIPPNLYLKGQLGRDEAALFSSKDDARNNCTIIKPEGWNCEWDFPNDNEFHLKIFTDNDTLFEKGESIEIRLSEVISKTAPGSAELSFATDLSEGTQGFKIAKVAEVPDIIYFISEPEEGVQNLPGARVTLKWRTSKLEKLELTRVGSPDPLRITPINKDEGSYTHPTVSVDMVFRLKGYDGDRPIERELSVKVLRAGWYDITNILLEGDRGYSKHENKADTEVLQEAVKQCSLEPTLLLNANNKFLYAVFRHIFGEKERAFLFRTENPFGPWEFIESSVIGRPEGIRIPDGFSTSPGVYFDDKLWLIGGSQIDPDIVSNHVWRCDPKIGIWEKWGAAKWPARMGHAVLVYQGKIWVLGGVDAAGNALNDVWTTDVTANEWTQLKVASSWEPRCLFNPVVFKDRFGCTVAPRNPSPATYTMTFTGMRVAPGRNWR